MPDERPDDRSPLEDHPLTAARLAKLDEWIAQAIDPYPPGAYRTHTAADIADTADAMRAAIDMLKTEGAL